MTYDYKEYFEVGDEIAIYSNIEIWSSRLSDKCPVFGPDCLFYEGEHPVRIKIVEAHWDGFYIAYLCDRGYGWSSQGFKDAKYTIAKKNQIRNDDIRSIL